MDLHNTLASILPPQVHNPIKTSTAENSPNPCRDYNTAHFERDVRYCTKKMKKKKKIKVLQLLHMKTFHVPPGNEKLFETYDGLI